MDTRTGATVADDTEHEAVATFPESMQFMRMRKRPTGKPLLVVSYEVSGTTTVFEIVK